MYATAFDPVVRPVIFRLIGVLDDDLVTAFGALERGLAAARLATVVVDVGGLDTLNERSMDALTRAVARARAEGRDVRLDARGLHWKRLVRKNLAGQPVIDAELRGAYGRTVILAHSGKRASR